MGAKAFADALLKNETIATTPSFDTELIAFDSNKIGKEGAFALIKAIDKTKRYAHSLLLIDVGMTNQELEEYNRLPETLRSEQRSKNHLNTQPPPERCTIA